MRAVVVHEFGPPGVMHVEQTADPVPGTGHVLIQVNAAGINPVDTYVRSGTYARKPSLPYVPGMDVAGVVRAVGDGVTRHRPGDRVYAFTITGGYAELALAEEWQVQPLPEGLSFQQGAAVGVPYTTAWRALFGRGAAKPGETVLVHGASGGVGLAAVQIARAHGLRVLGTAGSDEGLTAVRQQGAHHAVSHRAPDCADQILALTDGAGVNLVLEMLANVNLDRDLDLLAFRGRVVVIGNRGRIEIDPRKTMAKEAAILGMTVFNTSRDELREIHAGIGAGLSNGTLKPVVGRELPFTEAVQAHELVMQPGALGKIVLVP